MWLLVSCYMCNANAYKQTSHTCLCFLSFSLISFPFGELLYSCGKDLHGIDGKRMANTKQSCGLDQHFACCIIILVKIKKKEQNPLTNK